MRFGMLELLEVLGSLLSHTSLIIVNVSWLMGMSSGWLPVTSGVPQYLKFADSSFPLMDYIQFASSSTRFSSSLKLVHVHSKSTLSHHCYFSRVVRLWNALPPIDLDSSYCSIKQQLKRLFWSHFLSHFNSANPCSFHWVCPCLHCSKLPTHTNFSTYQYSHALST